MMFGAFTSSFRVSLISFLQDMPEIKKLKTKELSRNPDAVKKVGLAISLGYLTFGMFLKYKKSRRTIPS
jgi:hypothetical protein